MKTEIITKRHNLIIRRLILTPGETMPWHTDSCHRFSVVIQGDKLCIEFRDSGEKIEFSVYPGMADWDEPEDRIHRGANAGNVTYEEVVTFYLDRPDMEPQPEYT